MRTGDILSREKDIGAFEHIHEILVKGEDFKACTVKALAFFDAYQLVRYSYINIVPHESISASSPVFENRLKSAVLENHRILNSLTKELQEEDVLTIDNLRELPQGYKSKMLHVITHLLDGFFGIDSYFYNLEEDSHWVSEELMEKIKTLPEQYWLLYIEAAV